MEQTVEQGFGKGRMAAAAPWGVNLEDDKIQAQKPISGYWEVFSKRNLR